METLTAGTITVVFSSMIALMRPLKSLTNVNAQFQRDGRLPDAAILDSEQEKDEGTRLSSARRATLNLKRHLYLSGPRNAALRNINLNIPEGKTVALVGVRVRVNRPLPA
jgi:subfamily B ATP-binding cassette protein MsbA